MIISWPVDAHLLKGRERNGEREIGEAEEGWVTAASNVGCEDFSLESSQQLREKDKTLTPSITVAISLLSEQQIND